MAWHFDGEKPIYSQIIEHIKLSIISGEYKPGDKLNSVRDLAQVAGVNPNTMQKALSELENSGLIYTNRTSGRFITDNVSLIEAKKKELAREKTLSYLSAMEKLGYSAKDCLNLISE